MRTRFAKLKQNLCVLADFFAFYGIGSAWERSRLVSLGRSYDQRYRAFIDDGDAHRGGKDAGFNGDAGGLQLATKAFVKRNGDFRFGGSLKARPIAFAAVAGERELADDQGFAADVMDGKVHFSSFVGENAQSGAFGRQPVAFGFPVALFDAQ